MRFVVLLCLAASLCGCGGDPPGRRPVARPMHFAPAGSVAGPGSAAADAGSLYLASGAGLAALDGDTVVSLAADGLPAGHVTQLLAFDGSPDALVAYVWGKGLFRSADAGASFAPLPDLPTYDALGAFLTPRAKVVPFGGGVDRRDPARGVLAGPGGLYLSEDAGASWSLLSVNASTAFYFIFLDAAIEGETIVAVAQAASSLLPPDIGGLVGGGVVRSDDGGQNWEDITGELFVDGLTSVSLHDGAIYVGGMHDGAFVRDGDGWRSIDGPNDVVAVEADAGGVSIGSASRGVWRADRGGTSQAGAGAVAAVAGSHALGYDGSLWSLADGAGQAPPAPAGGRVHLALSFHVNLYHSFRGDSPGEDGYGQDITVIRNTLDWLDAYPEVRADWDMDNAFSVDGWLASDAPDILERVRARVEDGRDQVRLMSWNNGAVSAQTYEEFAQSVERAKQSNAAAFGSFVPGVQPQENMFSPDHVGWYPALGIDWITLFYSMSPFTGPPLDLALEGAALYNPVTLRDGGDSMTLVPVYNHADVFDRGGLRAWIRQIEDSIAGDTLLVIHFDADGETWLEFDREIAAIADLPITYTTIQDYLDAHPPVDEVTLAGDQADGIGDGYQSWAEKDINHEIYTEVARARATADWARAIAPDDAGVAQLADEALTPRLLALSTTNFGLASPYLHPDREISARAYAAQSLVAAQAALAAAEALAPVADGSLVLVNPRPSAGPALVETTLAVPAAVYAGDSALSILDGASEIPALVSAVDPLSDPVVLSVAFVAEVPASGSLTLGWRYDPAHPASATGSAQSGDSDALEASGLLGAPFTECLGSGRSEGSETQRDESVDARAVRSQLRQRFELPFCDGSGSVVRDLEAWDGLPGIVVAVDATMGAPSDAGLAESVALTPLSCPAHADAIRWQTFGGIARERPVRLGQESWNGQSADGWASWLCAGADAIQVSHRVHERTSIAFAPMRTDGAHSLIAPLGTLWGDTPWHGGRRAGGIGTGEIVAIITPQFNPTAPDWSAKAVRYRLLVGSDIDEAVLDLFAHPPLVRAGGYLPIVP